MSIRLRKISYPIRNNGKYDLQARAAITFERLAHSKHALFQMYGRIWKAWNLMLILISNSQRLETRSPCKSANYFEGI